MLWYGFINKKQTLKHFVNKNKKLKTNLKGRKIKFTYQHKNNLNTYNLFFYIPTSCNFYIFKNNKTVLQFLTCKNYCFYIYNNLYFYNFCVNYDFLSFYFDISAKTLNFKFKYYNNFYAIYWNLFKKTFFSFFKFFFKKLKFKGKGYYIFKNFRNTIALQFGYSHKIYIYNYFIFVKFLSKTSVILFGINKDDISLNALLLHNTRTYNIFTGKGVRFSKQIIYKKIGKVSSYR